MPPSSSQVPPAAAAGKHPASLKAGLLTALLPLVAFWVIETYWGLEAALIAGCVTAVLELGYERHATGRIGAMTWTSNGLVLGLGAVSYVMNSGVAFKLQPAAMELIMAGVMGVMAWRGAPFLLQMMKDNPLLDDQKRELVFQNPAVVKKLVATDRRLLVFLVLHGLVLAAVAVWGTTAQWILLKGVLFYVLLVLVMVPMYIRPRAP